MTKCINCGEKAYHPKTAIHRGKILEGCEHCMERLKDNSSYAREHRESQKKQFRKDLVQSVQPREFIQAYPDEARNIYDDKTLRKYG